MLRFVLRISVSLLFVFLALSSFSQTRLPNTLLWRISGNGLQKPSYLFGTMHLPDKRLFHFGDSLYAALEATEGFAMELNANDAIDSVIRTSFRKAEREYYLEKQSVSFNRQKLGKSADSLLRSMGIKGNSATKKDLKTIRDRRMSGVFRQGEMPTFVDAYLLGLALRLNKWTGGIEDVNDQLDLSDELGGGLEPEQVLQPETSFQRGVADMIRIYLAQDLNAIEAWTADEYNPGDKDEILIRRNVKMAFRMDSLSHGRSTFFAVGAAHLPGDSGVITLLRRRGFAVEPVFASAKIFAGDYAAKLNELQWKTVAGLDSAFTVNMPGTPSDHDAFGELFKMKIYFDMTTMTFYMAGSVVNASAEEGKLDEMARGMVQRISGKTTGLKIKPLRNGTLSGREVEVGNADAAYRVRFYLQGKTVFLLMAGAVKQSSVKSADADRFFASFAPGKTAEAKPWQRFTLPDKGFAVQMPVKPERNTAIDENVAQEGSWQSFSYNAVDPQKGFYYLVQVREPAEGYVVENDSGFLRSMMDDYQNRVGEVLSSSFENVQGYPALYLDGYIKKADAVYKILYLTRANRVYMLVGGAPKGQPTGDAERFLQSFTLLPYEASALKTEAGDGFATTAPGPIKKQPADSTEKQTAYAANYLCRDAVSAVNYQVFKQTLSPLYWTRNDAVFFNAKIDQYTGYADSLLSKQWTQNGGVKGMDAWIRVAGDNGLKHLRVLVSGDTLYTLYATVPVQDTGRAAHRRFFTDFRISHEAPPVIYTPKTAQLLKALRSADSLTFADARENLDLVEFDKADLPLLYGALLVAYSDSGSYRSVNERLVSVISGLADGSTLDFIEKNYGRLKPETAPRQYNLLAVLAQMKTATAYAALKHYLLTGLPAAGDPGQLQRSLTDSLALTATLFPHLLKQVDDSLFGRSVAVVANHLLDSGLLSRNELLPFGDKLLAGSRAVVARIKAGDNEPWEFVEWSNLLSQLNTAEGNALLRQMLAQTDLYLKQNLILALLRNNLSVPASEINKVAADKSQRGGFYEELQKLKREALFPALYATQKSLAESELYNYLSEDYSDVELGYVGERTEVFAGRQSRFHLFKVRFAYEEEGEKKTYLAVAGPYPLAGKEKIVYSKASGFYEDEEFTPTKLAKLLKAYLKQVEPADE